MSSQDIASRILRYPLDLSGTSPDNYVEGEICHLTNLKNRGFVLSNGPFYTESLEVFDNVTGEKLTKKIQYTAAQLVEAATVRSGKEVCAVIIITDQAVSNEVRVNYQAVGGPYILNVDALTEMMSTIEIDDRPVVWGAIIGKPNLFPPGHHLHDAGDVYGFEYFVLALEEVRKAIIMGDVASHDEITSMIGDIEDRLTARIVLLENNFNGHLSAINNPHSVTKAQVGLGSVQNYGIATKVEAQQGIINTAYMTPLRVKEAIDFQAGNMLSAHVNDKTNPHAVTAAQAGAYSKSETNVLLDTKLDKTAQAVDSALLEGKNRASILTDAYAAVGTMGKRNLHVSSVAPVSTDGAVGDIWYQY